MQNFKRVKDLFPVLPLPTIHTHLKQNKKTHGLVRIPEMSLCVTLSKWTTYFFKLATTLTTSIPCLPDYLQIDYRAVTKMASPSRDSEVVEVVRYTKS